MGERWFFINHSGLSYLPFIEVQAIFRQFSVSGGNGKIAEKGTCFLLFFPSSPESSLARRVRGYWRQRQQVSHLSWSSPLAAHLTYSTLLSPLNRYWLCSDLHCSDNSLNRSYEVHSIALVVVCHPMSEEATYMMTGMVPRRAPGKPTDMFAFIRPSVVSHDDASQVW